MIITESEVLGIKSKQQLLFFCKQNLHNTHFIGQLVQFLNSNISALQIKVSWILTCLVKLDKKSVQNQFSTIVQLIYLGQKDAINRNLLSCIKQLQIEKENVINLYDACQKLSLSVETALAVKVNSLYVMLDILSIYPDFYHEFEQILLILDESEACSLKAAIKNCRIKMSKIKR
jgi:hypothetical protein